MTKKKRRRLAFRVGDIIAIPLAEGLHAYGKLYDRSALGVYDRISTELQTMDDLKDCRFRFFCRFFDTAPGSEEWPVVGHEPFKTKAQAAPPPMYYHDELSDTYEIRHRGKTRKATKKEIAKLDEDVWHYPADLIERIEKEFSR